MGAIAKDGATPGTAASADTVVHAHPLRARWVAPQTGLIARIAAALADAQAHPARSVVLLPYAQLMPLARQFWAEAMPNGFAPRFETTLNWAQARRPFAPTPEDISGDMARDTLAAQAWIERAGLRARGDALTGRLVDAAHQLASAASAVPPADRAAWAARARATLAGPADAPLLAIESALARIALEWAAVSRYATDSLFDDRTLAALDCLVVLDGFRTEPLAVALRARLGARAHTIALDVALDVPQPHESADPAAVVSLHGARDAEDEAQRAAACVLRHLEAGRQPVALVATDRALTRRIRAALAAHDVVMRDETGWKLSTTRVAADVMAGLRACPWDASADAVLDALKHAPAFRPETVIQLEKTLRRLKVQVWRSFVAMNNVANDEVTEVVARMEAARQAMREARPLAAWLDALRALLVATGQWEPLSHDAAGVTLCDVLRLNEGAAAELQAWPSASRRISLTDFTGWVQDVLEAASFVPRHPVGEQVVILPLSQLLARPVGAVVLPGCDEVRLPASPEPPGHWTAAQRTALGLPLREALEQAQREAWRYLLALPTAGVPCDVLWRGSDGGGEPTLASPLVQALRLSGRAQPGADPFEQRAVATAVAPRPLPRGAQLPVTRISATAYEDLRRCPYRFFALRQLGLREADELESTPDKRDFGEWLHAVLRLFQEALADQPAADASARRALLEAAAREARTAQRLDDATFLPFAAAWPRVRDGYLAWLTGHEAEGWQFEAAEADRTVPLGPLTLHGRIDRVDRAADGTALVMDYKTESVGVTRERLRLPLEDTQLAFYAALLEDDAPQAAYVNLGEKEGTRTYPQPEVVHARDALVEGLLHDLRRIADGAVLPALGEGKVCDWCAARGLCRKDFWT